MKMDEFLKNWDAMFEERDVDRVKEFLSNAIAAARVENDGAALLTIYNEAMGYFREHGAVKESYDYAKKAILQAQAMNLGNHPAYATTLQNAANVYRAGGNLGESLKCYEKVMECYAKTLDESDMLYASMYNNMALLKQEMDDYEGAKELLVKALSIVDENDNTIFEKATTLANLSSTCAVLNEQDDALNYGHKAITLFREIKVADAHYAAALNGIGTCYFKKGDYERAVEYLDEAAGCILKIFGETESYRRVKENARSARAAMGKIKGMDLCREYYETYGEPMLYKEFPEYLDKITVGLCGEGSDCSGFDDEYSRDHDWGPGFSIWMDKELYEEIGVEMAEAYKSLPEEFRGYKRRDTIRGVGRVGVCITEDYYNRILGVNWREDLESVPQEALFAAVSGEIFHSSDTKFERWRYELANEYPDSLRLRYMAEDCAYFSQGAQYNYPRMMRRGDNVSARISLVKGISSGMRLLYECEGKFPPCEKWLYKGLESLPDVSEERMLIWKILGSNMSQETEEMLLSVERLAFLLAERLYTKGFISDTDAYLDAHTDELITLSAFAAKSHEELVEIITEEEFAEFDKVINEGGRADCQDNWPTFRIMRISQYDVWTDEMLRRYLYDFKRNVAIGRNPIAEKYARMEASTAPEAYAKLEAYLPEMTDEQKRLIDAIASIQVGMMEEYSVRNPEIASRARSIRTSEDNLYNTSYETYLRGELSTYSAQMLLMYGRLIVKIQSEGGNIAEMIISNTLDMAGLYDEESEAVSCPLKRRGM